MRKMKDSEIEWIGEIPEDWEVGRVKNCYIHHKDVVGDNADNYERLALTLNGVIKRSKVDATGLQPEAFEGYQILRQNELVFKLIDLENVSTSRVGYSPFTGIVSPAYIVLNPRNEKESRFGEYFFLSMWQREVFNHLGDDGVRSSLNAKDLLDIPYPLVSSDEKQKIVTFLDSKCSEIDSVISKTKSSIEEYKKLKQSIIPETVTGKVKIENGKVCGKYDTYKDSGVEWIGEIPSAWEVSKLKPFLQWKSVKGFGNETVLSLYRDFGILPKESRDDNHNVTSLDTDSYKLVEVGDFVINKMKAWQGSMAISNYRGIVSPAYHVCAIKNSKIYKPYFHYLMRNKSYLPEYERLSSGLRIGQWDLSFEDFCQIKFIIPSLPEQQQISDFLDKKCSEIDKLITKKEQLVVEFESYKKSLIYEVVTGKREV